MSGNPTIKHTAITRAGYEYQDLIGLEILINYYRDPTLYSWVKLEADDTAARSLDDVVALRPDGSTEYVQVKFTVDAEKYELDWDWLLDSSGSGTSMLTKWANGLGRARQIGRVHSAQLKTNRVASATFADSLDGSFVDLGRVDKSIREKIEGACGGRVQAELFFKEFAFSHSLPDLDHLEEQLKGQLVPTDTDASGWLLLRNSVRGWAIKKNDPYPDGRITRALISSLISRSRPQPIRQDFYVPSDYSPPNESFDAQFQERVLDAAAPITLLWATPGRGKSTYLSYLTGRMRDAEHVVVRHHYFLTSEDSSAHRMSYVDIATSIYDQLITLYPEYTAGVTSDPERLRASLQAVAENLAAVNKRLFVIIDGLDHVYRDTRRTDQLNHLFNVILPLPENVGLIVGTQRVADDQLPGHLLTLATENDWIEIPRMNQGVVHRWVLAQHEKRPLALRWGDNARSDEEVEKIASAFYRVSQGHPLHLIYAYESVLRAGVPISADDIEALPPCPDGDIRTYYQGLWTRLSSSGKSILHVLAGSDFFWPSLGIHQCLGDYSEIEFLLEPHESGMVPFHGSIFAWVRERADHALKYKALLPRVEDWLASQAPDYWRWGWLWLIRAENGNSADLLNGVTRDWAVDSLASGWSERQLQNIIAAAEKITFAKLDLPTTVRLRSLKTRVSNAREFQAIDFGVFRGLSLAIAENQQQTFVLLDTLSDMSDQEVAALARLGPSALSVGPQTS